MLEKLISKEMTAALADVIGNMAEGRRTAAHSALSKPSVDAFKAGYRDLQTFLKEASKSLQLEKHGISVGMGNWISSGNVFPHIWGALFPAEGRKVSGTVPQLFVIRKPEVVRWGISLSVKSAADPASSAAISEFIQNREGFHVFLERGFEFDYDSTVPGHEKPTALVKSAKAGNLNSPGKLDHEIQRDLGELFPHFVELVEKFRNENLLVAESDESSSGEADEDSIEELVSEWSAWWLGSPEGEDMRVPEYLKREYGSSFSTMKQKWEAGQKEALAAINEATAGRTISEERKQALIMGSLRRTAFTGGWRNQVKDRLEDILRLVADFAKSHPSGCNQAELDKLVDDAKNICGTRIESVITRFLCDIKPSTYLPLGGFTNAVLTRAATIFDPDMAPSHKQMKYEEQLTLAKHLASALPEAKNGPNLYVFDHFLAWFNHLREESFSSEDQREPGVNYWVIAPGEGARLWAESVEKGTISLGWDEMGDLSAIPTLEAVKSKYMKLYQPKKNPKNNTKALFDFAHSIKPGDIIFAKEGLLRIVGMGKVTSDYIYDPARSEHHHIRKVDWTTSGIWDLDIHDRMAQKAVTNVTRYSEFVNRILGKVKGDKSTPKKPVDVITGNPYSLADAQVDLFMGEQQLTDILDSLRVKQNVILQGPPGVGKTFVAEKIAMALTGTTSKACIETVQFHPSYSYEDFVQGYRPNGESFELRDGLFVEFCDLARRNPETKFVLIVDEINRGNLSKIFGELLMLIEADKRNKEIKLTYSGPGERFSIPQNLYLIGTMNTADRSLSLVDYALRRRFAFFDVRPAFDSAKFEEKLKSQGVTEDQVRFVRTQLSSLNTRISQDTKYLGTGFEVGHSYFCAKPASLDFKQWYLGILKHEIAPLLREYWFDDIEKADREIAALKVA